MRRALMGLIMAATAITPIASAAAQDSGRWRGRGGDAQSQSGAETPQRSSRAERQAQRSERQTQRFENRAQRFENRTQGETRVQRFERRAPQVQQEAQRPVRTREFNRQRWSDTNRSDGGARFQQREPPSQGIQPTEQTQTREWNRDRSRTDGSRVVQRRDWDGNRDANRNWDGDRSGRWDGNRTRDNNWTGTRSGRWDGSSYRWNRDGRTYSWNSDWRRDRRYDWQDYRRYNRSIYNLGSYYSPYRNYRYRRFSIGFFLQPLFFGSNYWISDPWQYRLPPAYPGTRWVRYYDDVLLVDIYSGEVIDVIHGFFW